MKIKNRSLDVFMKAYLGVDPRDTCGVEINNSLIMKSLLPSNPNTIEIELKGRDEAQGDCMFLVTYEVAEYDSVNYVLIEKERKII